ncbi:MAG: heat-shock protein Hsp20 [Actinomycetia bacterium]|nr:heat-shock protein Hsp20 [Actinomycetes bacterium]
MSQLLPDRRRRASSERWEPLGELEQVTQRMRQMLDQTMGDSFLPAAIGELESWSPPVDIEEQDDAYLVEAEVPGVKRDDVNIELVGNELLITGEIKERERVGIIRRRTRRRGQFAYRVVLPEQVDAEEIDAKLDDGVLTVRVPKSQRARRRQVEIKG